MSQSIRGIMDSLSANHYILTTQGVEHCSFRITPIVGGKNNKCFPVYSLSHGLIIIGYIYILYIYIYVIMYLYIYILYVSIWFILDREFLGFPIYHHAINTSISMNQLRVIHFHPPLLGTEVAGAKSQTPSGVVRSMSPPCRAEVPGGSTKCSSTLAETAFEMGWNREN